MNDSICQVLFAHKWDKSDPQMTCFQFFIIKQKFGKLKVHCGV